MGVVRPDADPRPPLLVRGKHGQRYWSEHMAQYLRFYARALADC